MNKVLLKEKFVEITYQEDTKIVVAKWVGFLTVDQVKEGCDVMTSFIKTNKIKKHLSDHSDLKVLSKQVQEYLGGVWFNDVEKAGLTKIAVKVSADVFAQATVNNVNTKQKYGNLSIQTFGSYDNCYAWLNK